MRELESELRPLAWTALRIHSEESFPREFAPLSPTEIEDVLCIYKDRLGRKSNLRVRTAVEDTVASVESN